MNKLSSGYYFFEAMTSHREAHLATLSDGTSPAGAPSPEPAAAPDTALPPVLSELMIRQLVNLFLDHGGRVARIVLASEGFHVQWLLDQQLVWDSKCFHDAGLLSMGRALVEQAARLGLMGNADLSRTRREKL